MIIRFNFDPIGYTNKEQAKNEFPQISKRLNEGEEYADIQTAAEYIGNQGHAFTPAVYNGARKQENFLSKQIFAIDIDNNGTQTFVTFDDIMVRAAKFMIPVKFAYETLSSQNQDKFRIVFVTAYPVTDARTAQYIQSILQEIFPESDPKCNELARIFLGGKKLLYYNDRGNEYLDLRNLTLSLGAYLKDKYGSTHFLKHLENFALNTGVCYFDKHISIEEIDGKNCALLIDNNIGSAQFLPNRYYVIRFSDNTKQHTPISKQKSEERRKLERNFDYDKLYDMCQLFHEFSDGSRWLYHDELFGIATNLCGISGGNKLFSDILNSNENSQYSSYHVQDWAYYLSKFSQYDYSPGWCRKFCPYADECEHASTMIDTVKTGLHKISTVGELQLSSLNQAETSLMNTFQDMMNADDDKIHICIAQTGIGKSRTYIENLDEMGGPTIVAVPTKDLRDEIFLKCQDKGYNVMRTHSIPDVLPLNLIYKVDHLMHCGAKKQVVKYIKSEIMNSDFATRELEDYLEASEKLYNFTGHIITTHARMLAMPSSMLEKFNLIIDEDILRTLLTIEKVKIRDVLSVLNNNSICQSVKERLMYLLQTDNLAVKSMGKDNGYEKFAAIGAKCKTNISYVEQEIAEIIKIRNIKSNVIDFIRATAISIPINNGEIDMNGEIQYIAKKNLPFKKIIVLSATADVELYKKYFGEDRIIVHSCDYAEYEGKLIQYPSRSYSRRYFNEHQDVISKIQNRIGDMPVITFMKMKPLFSVSMDIHFGKTEGFNGYEGQDIAVVGTPNLHASVYLLYAVAFGVDISYAEMKYQEVRRGKFKFWMMVYSEPILQQIQMWLVESELEQAVGRARLLRNDCTVHLFSNFPLKQAEFVYDNIQ